MVELIGGTHSAGAFIRRAVSLGRDVVTANKALLAERGKEIFGEAARRGTKIGFEASVCGGIPIIRFLERGLAGERDETNAVRIRGRALGELLLVGKGAGAMPTATAVLADVIDLSSSSRRSVTNLT